MSDGDLLARIDERLAACIVCSKGKTHSDEGHTLLREAREKMVIDEQRIEMLIDMLRSLEWEAGIDYSEKRCPDCKQVDRHGQLCDLVTWLKEES